MPGFISHNLNNIKTRAGALVPARVYRSLHPDPAQSPDLTEV